MKLRMLELCAGNGGWSKAFMRHGWDVEGIDIVPQPLYPARLHVRDVLSLTPADIDGFDFACASTPCQEFSVWGMPHFHPNPPFPEMGIRIFRHVLSILTQSGVPFLMENVRAAERFVGVAVHRVGPFSFWGNSVSALFPGEAYQYVKGFWSPGGTRPRKSSNDQRFQADFGNKKIRAQFSAEIPAIIGDAVAAAAVSQVPRFNRAGEGGGAGGCYFGGQKLKTIFLD